MTKKQSIKLIRYAMGEVGKEISEMANNNKSMYARGLAGEGYNGGYRDALIDVLFILQSGTIPNNRGRLWWPDKLPL